MKVYLSSTYRDLVAYRKAVYEILRSMRYDVLSMEDYTATDRKPLDKCIADVEDSDVYVGLFAWRYGCRPPGQESSITELEYRAACSAKLRRLIFLANPHERWPKEGGEGAEKLAALRERLVTDQVVDFFDEPQELAGKVAAAIANLRNEQMQVEIEELRGRREDRDHELAHTKAARSRVNAPPVTIDQLFDRTQYHSDLRGYLDDARVRWIGVVGRGGMGKTALTAWVLQDHGLRGILWLSSRTTGLGLERLTADVGRLLGEPTGLRLTEVWQRRDSTLAEKIDALIASFPSTEYAVVLDGLEEELAGDGAVAEQGLRAFVEACLSRPDGPRIVATSREDPLIPFHALDVARTIRLDRGLDSEGAVLLLQSLDPQGDLGLREAPSADLQRAVERTRGIPRALEILAGLLQSDPAASLATLLTDDRLEAMTVESIVAEGYRRLGEDERLVMQALAVLNRPADETAVAFLLQPWFPGLPVGPCLRRLVRSHFVKADRATGEFNLQLSDREHAYRMIPEVASETSQGDAPEGPLTRNALELRSADFYADIRKPVDQWLTIHDVSPQLAEIEHCFKAGAYQRGAEVLDLIEPEHLYLWGHYTLIIELRKQLRGRGLPADLEASNCGGLAVACQVLGRFEESIGFYDEAVAAARTSGDRALLGYWVGHRGRLYRNQGHLEEALTSFQEALEISKELSHREQEGFWRDRTGLALRGLGRLQEAVDAHRQALSIAVEQNRRRDEGAALSNLGWALRLEGDTDEARDALSRAFAIAEEIDDLRGQVIRRTRLAYLSLSDGAAEEAIAACEESLPVARQLGDRREQSYALIGLGAGYLSQGRAAEAIKPLREARDLAAPETSHVAALKLGLAQLRRGAPTADAAASFADTIERCGAVLAAEPSLFEAQYTLATARVGAAVTQTSWQAAENRERLLAPALEAYGQALETCKAPVVLQAALDDLRVFAKAGVDGIEPATELLRSALDS